MSDPARNEPLAILDEKERHPFEPEDSTPPSEDAAANFCAKTVSATNSCAGADQGLKSPTSITIANIPVPTAPRIGEPGIGEPGPFQVIIDTHWQLTTVAPTAPRRRYECTNYEECLDLAAALNWDSFTCRGCNGRNDSALKWRACQALKKDQVARKICDFKKALWKHELRINKTDSQS